MAGHHEPGHDGNDRPAIVRRRIGESVTVAQGSLTNFSFPAGFSVFASNVRISVVPPTSSVTTSRSPATAVETMRAPFGRVAVISVRGGRDASL